MGTLESKAKVVISFQGRTTSVRLRASSVRGIKVGFNGVYITRTCFPDSGVQTSPTQDCMNKTQKLL